MHPDIGHKRVIILIGLHVYYMMDVFITAFETAYIRRVFPTPVADHAELMQSWITTIVHSSRSLRIDSSLQWWIALQWRAAYKLVNERPRLTIVTIFTHTIHTIAWWVGLTVCPSVTESHNQRVSAICMFTSWIWGPMQKRITNCVRTQVHSWAHFAHLCIFQECSRKRFHCNYSIGVV